MAVAYCRDAELLHVRPQYVKLCLRITQRGIERRLITLLECAEIDGLHRRVKLLLAFRFAVGICRDQRLGGKNLQPHQRRIGAVGWRLNAQVGVLDSR